MFSAFFLLHCLLNKAGVSISPFWVLEAAPVSEASLGKCLCGPSDGDYDRPKTIFSVSL